MSSLGDLNEELMRSIGRRLGNHKFIQRVHKFPPKKPDRIVAVFAESLYPAPVSGARVEFRILLNDDCTIIYVEEWPGSRWACRWDRHENDHNAREHFHFPPGITTDTAIDVDIPTEHNRAVTTALKFIEDRIRDIWGASAVSYPEEYEFDREYGPAIWK